MSTCWCDERAVTLFPAESAGINRDKSPFLMLLPLSPGVRLAATPEGLSMTHRAVLIALLLATSACAQDAAEPPKLDYPGAPLYTEDTPVEKIATDPAATAVLNKDIPGLLSDSRYPMFKSMSLKQMQEASGGDLSHETVNKAVADLQALPAH
jgi:hypothetical protein